MAFNPVVVAELVERLNEELSGADPGLAIDFLRPVLDRRPIEPIVEYLAYRLAPLQGEGDRRVTFEYTSGSLRRTRFAHDPVGNRELEELARVVPAESIG